MAWNTARSSGEILTSTQWNEVISEISTGRVSGQTTDFVTGSSTQFAPDMHGLNSTYHSALTDVTTFDASTTAHGFMPKLDQYSTKFITSTGGFAALSSLNMNVMSSAASGILIGATYSTRFLSSTGGFVNLTSDSINPFSSDVGGLVPIGTTYSTKFLSSTGGWLALSSLNINQFTSSVSGLVPVGTTYSTQYLTSTGGWAVPSLNLTKTVTLYAGNSMLATTTYATLGQALTTANTINFIYADFSTLADRLQWGVQMDQGWNSSNLYATFNWTAMSTVAGDVEWLLSGIRVDNNSTIHTAVAALSTVVDTFLGSSTCYAFHRSPESTNFLVTGSGNYITFDLQRKTSNSFSTNARILNVEIRGTYASTY